MTGRPVLCGTISIEKSERLSGMLKRQGVRHVVLNAKYHEKEAEIVAQAGGKGNVTIATNMAGRGTDILLGGNPEHMARQQALKEGVANEVPKAEFRVVDDEADVYFSHENRYYRTARADWERIFRHFKNQTDADHEQVVACGGLHIIGPSDTRRGGSTISCAGAPAARVTPAPLGSTCRSKTT